MLAHRYNLGFLLTCANLYSLLKFKSFQERLRAGVETYHKLKELLKKEFGHLGELVGYEGGLVPPIKEFEKKTNVGALLNTSFNLHENPIASLEKDIIYSFESNAADCLLFPPYISYQKEMELSLY